MCRNYYFVKKIKVKNKKKKVRTIASSGSRLGSTPNSKSFPVLGPAVGTTPVPPSSSGILELLSADRIGEEMRASERRWAPGGTARRCLDSKMIKSKRVHCSNYIAGDFMQRNKKRKTLTNCLSC